MPLTSNTISVGTSPVALHAAGPVSVTVRNLGLGVVLVGLVDPASQDFPLLSGQTEEFIITASDVLYAKSESGTNKVAVIYM